MAWEAEIAALEQAGAGGVFSKYLIFATRVVAGADGFG